MVQILLLQKVIFACRIFKFHRTCKISDRWHWPHLELQVVLPAKLAGAPLPACKWSAWQGILTLHFLETPGHATIQTSRPATYSPAPSLLRLCKSTSHDSLEPISSSTWVHLIDVQDMKKVNPHPKVEGILSSIFCHVFLPGNSSTLKIFTGHILLPADKVYTEGEHICTLLHIHIIDQDLAAWTPWQYLDFG